MNSYRENFSHQELILFGQENNIENHAKAGVIVYVMYIVQYDTVCDNGFVVLFSSSVICLISMG